MNGRNIQPNLFSLHNGEAIEMSHSIVSNKKRSVNGNDTNKIINDNQQYTSTTTIRTNGALSRKREAEITTNGSSNNENHKENDQHRYDNNSMKFAFLAQQTTPDYRSQAMVSN